MEKLIQLYIFLFIVSIALNCQTCKENNSIINSNCFNEIKIFDFEDKNYRAGHFATNSKGDMIIEYSYNQYRLFFGLDKYGKNLFPNLTREIELYSNNIDESKMRRYESTNLFVSLMDDESKEKEYLMSVSSYITVVELYDIENNNYTIIETTSFVGKPKGIFSFVFQILEGKMNNKIVYFCVYIYCTSIWVSNENDYKDFGNNYVIKRFALNSFNLDSFSRTESIEMDNYTNRIISTLIIQSHNILIVFSMQSSNYFYLHCYNFYDLSRIANYEIDRFGLSNDGYGIFFKSCLLIDNYFAFLYFVEENEYKLGIYNFYNTSKTTYHFERISNYYDQSHILSHEITLNDFLKLDNERLSFISTTDNNKLYIILFDLYFNYRFIKVRYYKFDFSYNISAFTQELSAHLYNGFLAFTSTVSDYNNKIFSLLIFFGYANGTDFEIDISPYFIDSDSFSNSSNLINDIMDKLVIDNNIFAYEKDKKIKLISIPQEIYFITQKIIL